MASRIVSFRQSLRNVVQSRKFLETNKQWRRHSSLAAVQERFTKRATNVSELDSGLKVATENTGVPTATVGVWIAAGSRFETDETNGVTNFLEHMVFKGTTSRSQADLERELESLGASIDAYTSREHTVFYAKCVKENVPKVVEILADIVSNPKISEADIETTRQTILNDIDMAPLNLKNVLFDYMHATAYQQTPLSRSILGSTINVKSLTKQNLVDYQSLFYKPARMTLIGAGGVNHDELVKLGNQFFNQQPASMDHPLARSCNVSPCRFTGSDLRHRDDYIPYCHAAFAVEGVPYNDPAFVPLALVNNMLGSWDRSQGIGSFSGSSIARAAAEGKAIAYEAFNIVYSDTALWGFYHVSPLDKVEFMGSDIADEMRRLCTSINPKDIERGKNRMKMSLLLAEENTTGLFNQIGSQLQLSGKRQPFHELVQRIDSITPPEVRDVLQSYWYDQCPVLVGIGPTEDLMDYEMLRSKMFWWMF